MRRENSNSRQVHGFTLIEMVVVVVIIGITAAMIIPEMRGTFQDALLRAAGRDLANAVNLASSRAVSLNQLCRLNLDTRKGRYAIERQAHDGGRVDYVPLKDLPGDGGILDTRVTMEVAKTAPAPTEEANALATPEVGAPDAIVFYPDGTAESAEIKLRDRDGYQLVLLINPVTSRVHLVEPKRE
jgi:type II secretion system protein H